MNRDNTDQRKTKLTNWAMGQIAELMLAHGKSELSVVSGDASFRRYFRLTYGNDRFILVDAPPAHENCTAFVVVADLFRAAGMNTPKVLAVDYDQGFMLLQDFGDKLFLPVLQNALLAGASEEVLADAEKLYDSAIKALIRLQKNAPVKDLADYDRALLHREMLLFEEWFCSGLLGHKLTAAERDTINSVFQFLEDEALAQPVVAVHRDYHSRNLMIPTASDRKPELTPGVIDFQDAVAGPYTYDLISLLRDCYIKWPTAKVYARAMSYLRLAQDEGIVAAELNADTFKRHLDLMGLQRHLKVLGIFSRLSIRDHKPQYLGDLPLVIDYTVEVLEQYPELAKFTAWFKGKILPAVRETLAAQPVAGSSES